MKKSFSDLALLGGEKSFTEHLHVGRPNIGDEDKLFEYLKEIIDNKWLTNNGPFVQKFEKQLSEMLGVRHCIAMCNATIALEITIRGLDMHGEVIVPAFTFIATAHALQWQEITPVFCDTDPETHTIDSRQIEKLLTPRTTGIIGVHVWGRPCNIEALTDIARQYNLKIIFDASHAFGCTYKGNYIGTYGNAEIFSFHATKFLNTFEGGLVSTNDDDLAAKIRLMKNFGFTGYDKVDYIGTNGKMNEFCAAVGLTSLSCMDDFIEMNYQNYKHYRDALKGVPGLKIINYDESQKCNYQYIVLEIDESVTNISRDQLQRILQAENILARRYFYPGCHRMEPYKSYFPHAKLLLQETEKLVDRVLLLPTGTSVTTEDINKICQIICIAVEFGQELKQKIS